MDRFIAYWSLIVFTSLRYLKSNMDRFIVDFEFIVNTLLLI